MAGGRSGKKIILSFYSKLCLILCSLILVFNLCVWCSKPFCDWYVRKIFPLAVNTLGRFSNLFPFTLGDIFLVVTVLIILSALLMLVMSPFFGGRIWRVTKLLWRFILVYVLVVVLELSMNWFVLYHTTSIRDKEIPEGRQYTNSEYALVYNYIAENLNRLTTMVHRDADGICQADIDVNQEAIRLMSSMGTFYPELSGYYPTAKEMGFSDFFSQQYIAGYYFPVTMEANINANMYEINDPSVTCHELSHLKGIIREDEAEYLAILACMSSDSIFFKYSGYLSAFSYLESNMPPIPDDISLIAVADSVRRDDVFIPWEVMEKIDENAIISTEVMSDISDNLVDTSLKVNGIEEGIYSYNLVTTMLMHHFLDK